MRRLSDFLARLRGSLTKNDVESRLAEEIEFHLDMHAQREIRAGAEPDARDAAPSLRSAVERAGAKRLATNTVIVISRALCRTRATPFGRSENRRDSRPSRSSRSRSASERTPRCSALSAEFSSVRCRSRIPRGSHRSGPRRRSRTPNWCYLQQHAKAFESVAAFSPGLGHRAHTRRAILANSTPRAFRRTTSKRLACVPRSAVHSHPANHLPASGTSRSSVTRSGSRSLAPTRPCSAASF